MWKVWSFPTGALAASVALAFASWARPPSKLLCYRNSAGSEARGTARVCGAEGTEGTEGAESLLVFSVLSVYSARPSSAK